MFDGYFINRKEVLINLTKRSKIFSKFDCISRLWQLKKIGVVTLHAFSIPRGRYHWYVMLFWLNIALQIFQRWLDSIFNDLKKICNVYIDNIFIFSKTREDHEVMLNIFNGSQRLSPTVLAFKKRRLWKTPQSY